MRREAAFEFGGQFVADPPPQGGYDTVASAQQRLPLDQRDFVQLLAASLDAHSMIGLNQILMSHHDRAAQLERSASRAAQIQTTIHVG